MCIYRKNNCFPETKPVWCFFCFSLLFLFTLWTFSLHEQSLSSNWTTQFGVTLIWQCCFGNKITYTCQCFCTQKLHFHQLMCNRCNKTLSLVHTDTYSAAVNSFMWTTLETSSGNSNGPKSTRNLHCLKISLYLMKKED